MSAALTVVAPGLHSTIQDLGRFGYQAAGVPLSGALDPVAFRLANRLLGNPDNAPALEMLHHGPTLEVAADSVHLALAGGGAGFELLGEHPSLVEGWRSLVLGRGQRFRIGRTGESVCCYLAAEDGFQVPPCLGSASTYVRGGFGGLAGRALIAGDGLPLARMAAGDRPELALRPPPDAGRNQAIRVVLGPQEDYFTQEAVATLLGAEFTVSPNADRMGLRLDGPALAHRDGYNIVSDGIATGAIQVPGSGQAILLLADHQTTGGYPKIATVISADLPVVGRRRPGDRVRFTAVSQAEAEELRRAEEAMVERLSAAMAPPRGEAALDIDLLHRVNLISGVVSGDE